MQARAITTISTYLLALFLVPPSLFLSGCGGAVSPSTSTQQIVVPVPVVSLTMSPTAVLPGQRATLTWSAASANSCIADGAWSGTQQMSGSINVALSSPAAQNYALSCTNSIGQTVRSAVTLALSPADGACAVSHAVTSTGRQIGKRRASKGKRS